MRQAPDCCARGGFPFIALLVELLLLVHWSWAEVSWGTNLLLWSCCLHHRVKHLWSGKI